MIASKNGSVVFGIVFVVDRLSVFVVLPPKRSFLGCEFFGSWIGVPFGQEGFKAWLLWSLRSRVACHFVVSNVQIRAVKKDAKAIAGTWIHI